MKHCSVSGCAKPHKGHGLCDGHLRRKRQGQEVVSLLRAKAENGAGWEWINEHLAKRPEGCWYWPWAATIEGYGLLYDGTKMRRVTHLTMEAVGSQRPDVDAVILHACDNPPCCNPAHLRWGTPAENNADMSARGRDAHGEAHYMSQASDAVVAEARRLSGEGWGPTRVAALLGVPVPTVDGWLSGRTRVRSKDATSRRIEAQMHRMVPEDERRPALEEGDVRE